MPVVSPWPGRKNDVTGARLRIMLIFASNPADVDRFGEIIHLTSKEEWRTSAGHYL